MKLRSGGGVWYGNDTLFLILFSSLRILTVPLSNRRYNHSEYLPNYPDYIPNYLLSSVNTLLTLITCRLPPSEPPMILPLASSAGGPTGIPTPPLAHRRKQARHENHRGQLSCTFSSRNLGFFRYEV
jgi:hypothetical protein